MTPTGIRRSPLGRISGQPWGQRENPHQPHTDCCHPGPAGRRPPHGRGSGEPRRMQGRGARGPHRAQPPLARHPPHLGAVDPALLEGALVRVAGTHVAVLTPVAGVRAANAGHAPGGGAQRKASETTEKAGWPLATPPRGQRGNGRKKAPGPSGGLHRAARDDATRGQRSARPLLTTDGRCSCKRQSPSRRTARPSPWRAAAAAPCAWPLRQGQGRP